MARRIYIRHETPDVKVKSKSLQETASIDAMIEDAMSLVSHPLKCTATILMDSNGSRIRKEDLSTDLRKVIRSTKYEHVLKLKNLTEELLRLEAITYRKISNLKGGHDTFLDLSKNNHLFLSLPYFMLEQSIHQGLPIEEIIGRTGNKKNSSAHSNKMRYLLSFYLEDTYPSRDISSKPETLNRGQIQRISQVHETTIRKIDSKLEKEGYVISKKNAAQRKYFVARDFREYQTYRSEFQEKLDDLVKSGRFEVNDTVLPEDFKEALNDNEWKVAGKVISRLSNKGFIYSIRDQMDFALTSKGRHLAEDIFIPVFRAAYQNSAKGIIDARKRHIDNPKGLLRDYFVTFGR